MEAVPRRAGLFFFVLVPGVALGIVLTMLALQWVGPDLLSPFHSGSSVEGRVLNKALESDRLLLKIEAEDGVLLATFTERQEEIDLLVDPGDTLTLDVKGYQPFLADPAIERVRRTNPPVEPEEPQAEGGVKEEPRLTEPPEVGLPAESGETERPV